MALNKLKFNSFNVTPAASTAIRFNSDADGFETASAGGSLVKISTTTISADTSAVSITSGINSTYKKYIFFFNNVHHDSTGADFLFNMSVDSGSNYNVAKTTTYFKASHSEGDQTPDFGYVTGRDLAQGTGGQIVSSSTRADDDSGISGFIHLFDPSSTTFVKHFIARFSDMTGNPGIANDNFSAGYGNTTSAVDAVQFSMSSGNLDSGSISLYGVS